MLHESNSHNYNAHYGRYSVHCIAVIDAYSIYITSILYPPNLYKLGGTKKIFRSLHSRIQDLYPPLWNSCRRPWLIGPWYENTRSSEQLEVHSISQRRQRRTEPRPELTWTKYLVDFGCMVFELYQQTNRHTYHSILIPPSRGEVVINKQWLQETTARASCVRTTEH